MTLTPEDIRERVARNIRRARTDAGLSQIALAEAIDAKGGRHDVWRWETAFVKPKDEHLIAIALATGRPFEWFFADHNGTP